MGTAGTAKRKLELAPPSAECPYCRFSASITGRWSAEDGRLVFRADADPQPRRGPDLAGCCEGSECGGFSGVTVTWGDDPGITGEQYEALKATAEQARADEMRATWPGAR